MKCSTALVAVLGLAWIAYVKGTTTTPTVPIAPNDPRLNNDGFETGELGGPSFGGVCWPPCTVWEVCEKRFGPDVCVLKNECTPPCPSPSICCGHNHCSCPWPNIVDTDGDCRECDCPWNEVCTIHHGQCVCGDNEVRDATGHCVECDPTLSCPKCPKGKICTIHQGDMTSSCECLPGSVENGAGECVWCHPCPYNCDRGHVCITPGFSDPYCGCPPGTDEDADGDCVPVPKCPVCTHGQVCVVKKGLAECRCPFGTYDTGLACAPLYACPHCDPPEVCIVPKHGFPHCACPNGTVSKHGRCLECEAADICNSNSDCPHTGQICVHGICDCPPDWQLINGSCTPDGHPGGSCKKGKCKGKRTKCGDSGKCECTEDCYPDPRHVCVPRRKQQQFW